MKEMYKRMFLRAYMRLDIFFYVDLRCGPEYRQKVEKPTRVGRQFSTSLDLANEKSNFKTIFEEIAKEF